MKLLSGIFWRNEAGFAAIVELALAKEPNEVVVKKTHKNEIK
jgi:hypothetical protein